MPIQRDSDDEPVEEIFAPIEYDDENIDGIDNDAVEVMTLDENDEQPDIEEGVENLDFEDIDQEENGFLPDDSRMVFHQHTGSVFSIGLSSKDQTLAVSGGEDDKGYVWKIDVGEIAFVCDGHKDSVISCGFSPDGKYVMTADMSGVIIVRDVKDGKKIWDFECTNTEWCFWHSSINVLFAGVSDGEVYMWKIPSGDCKIYQGHGSAVHSACLLKNGKSLLAGYSDGCLKLWDLQKAVATFSYQCNSFMRAETVLCVGSHPMGNLVACGTMEGTVRVLNEPAGKLIITYAGPSSSNNDDTDTGHAVESLAFSPTEQYLAAGSLNGILKIWDLSSQRLRHTCKHPEGISHVIWHESHPNIVVTACLDGIIRLWDSRSGELVQVFNGNQGHILDLCLSVDGRKIITAGDDQTIRIFER